MKVDSDAKTHFAKNIQLIGSPKNDQLMWNLSCGLLALAHQLDRIELMSKIVFLDGSRGDDSVEDPSWIE